MQVIAYNSEKFQKSKRRYVIFATIFASVFVLSILNNNIVGAVLLFFLLGGYFYYSVSNSQLIKLSIAQQGLIIGTKTYNRTVLTWYVLEIDAKTQKIKNIVFLTRRGHTIHTFKDDNENIKNFIILLNDYLPMVWEYNQSFLEKLTRKLQL